MGILVFSVASYLVFLFAFLYAIWFVWTMDGRAPAEAWRWSLLAERAFLVDAGLLALFAVQHSVMARPAFKAWWTRTVPAAAERSVYVLAASLILIALVRFWQPLPGVVWDLHGTVLELPLQVLFWSGWGLVLVATFLIDHFALFGLRQGVEHARGRAASPAAFVTPGLYRVVRHPIMLGFVIAFWAAPLMTAGHLFFAGMTTAYILVAIQLEERDLLAAHGEAYARYRSSVGMLVPVRRRAPV